MTFLRYGNKDIGWNILDSFLVAFSLVDQLILLVQMSSPPDMSIMRTLRIFRLVRVFRVLRVARFFNDLRMMVSGIISSMKLLVWAVLLLLVIAFIFAVSVLELVSMEIDALQAKAISVEEMRQILELSWGSLIRAIYTLFQSIS